MDFIFPEIYSCSNPIMGESLFRMLGETSWTQILLPSHNFLENYSPMWPVTLYPWSTYARRAWHNHPSMIITKLKFKSTTQLFKHIQP